MYVKVVHCSDESTENHHQTLQFSSALQSLWPIASFSSLFWFATLLFWFTLTSIIFSHSRELFTAKKLSS